MDDHGLRMIAQAAEFAARAHTGQTRKGSAREPYVSHVAEVAARLAQSPDADEPTLVAARHDVVEDTGHGLPEIGAAFGAVVAGLVAEVTDDKSLPKAGRKRLQVVDAPGKSRGIKRIKLADKASNLTALVDSPPRAWDLGRRRRYLDGAREVVAGLRGIDPVLEDAFDREAARLEAAIDGS